MIVNHMQFMGELDPETAALYARQAAAAAGAGRAAQAASDLASARGQEQTQAQEQAQAAVMERAAAVASGSYRPPPWYQGKGLLFVGIGGGALLLYLAMRSPSRPAVYYSRPRPRKS